MNVYLDYNASAPINEDVLECMFDVYRNAIGNADSRTHLYGETARNVVETARKQVASLLAVKPDEIFFTSGATESNNIAIQGLREYAQEKGKKHIITTSIEHKAILETVKSMEREGFEVEFVSPDLSGRVDAEKVLSKVRDDNYYLYSLVFANANQAQADVLMKQFHKCENQHLNAVWASEKLYIPGLDQEKFGNVLEENLGLVYDSAKLQEYEMWVI